MRPVLLGMNNPHSDDPEDVLSPRFPGSAGARLYQMVRAVNKTVSEHDYLAYLDRRNLMVGEWDRETAKSLGVQVRTLLAGRKVVLLGTMLPSCLCLHYAGGWYHWQVDHDVTYCVAPHPSGLNRVYNDVEYQHRTGELLASLILEQKQCAT